MAYLAFAETTGGDVVETALHQSLRPPVGESRLSALEWSVVALAGRDTLATLRAPSRMEIAMGMLFGQRPNPRLADEKLEALRRMAVLGWHHGYVVPSWEIRAFVTAGYTIEQYETLLKSISAGRAARQQGIRR
ncbi:MAG: hypothetical protein WC804_00755 [Sphingomonas sp.]|jgi:hypothetical protein|uniref:hypothetical protein n=1 Tax=Sphingomonas sp. TaxID=28214 RepID=UPI003561E7B8